MTTTQTYSIRTATFTADGSDVATIRHTDPECPNARGGERIPTSATDWDCRYCVGGAPWTFGTGRLDAVIPASDTERNEGNYKAPGAPAPADAPVKPYELRLAEISTWLLALDRKVEVSDIGFRHKKIAAEWLQRYTGDFSFLLDVKAKGGVKSDGQAKGVLNCLRAELLRAPKNVTPVVATPKPEPTTAGLNLVSIPAGRYAFQPEDGQAQFLQIDQPDRGNWAGWTFVKRVYGGDNVKKAGSQKPGALYRGDAERALAAILADPRAAMALYGHLIGSCGVCNRELTNEDSRARGIGPTCAQKYGWS